MTTKFIRMVALAAITCVAVGAIAQNPPAGGGGRGGFGQGRRFMTGPMLIYRQDVQADLKLTNDEKDKIDAVREKMQASFQPSGSGERPSQEEMRAMFKKMNDDLKAQLATILTPEQQTRFRQINIQLTGNRAVLEPENVKDLAITDAQKTKIQDLIDKMNEANGALRRDQSLSREDRQTKTENNLKALNTEIDKILTDDQKAKWKTLAGPPFTATDDN